jgi:tetratricopeptide (TPR) repeat protein
MAKFPLQTLLALALSALCGLGLCKEVASPVASQTVRVGEQFHLRPSDLHLTSPADERNADLNSATFTIFHIDHNKDRLHEIFHIRVDGILLQPGTATSRIDSIAHLAVSEKSIDKSVGQLVRRDQSVPADSEEAYKLWQNKFPHGQASLIHLPIAEIVWTVEARRLHGDAEDGTLRFGNAPDVDEILEKRSKAISLVGKDPNQAIALWTECISFSDDREARTQRAVNYEAIKEYSKALADVEVAFSLPESNMTDRGLYLQRAELYIDMNDLPKADADLRNAEKSHYDDAWIHLVRSRLLRAEGHKLAADRELHVYEKMYSPMPKM